MVVYGTGSTDTYAASTASEQAVTNAGRLSADGFRQVSASRRGKVMLGLVVPSCGLMC